MFDVHERETGSAIIDTPNEALPTTMHADVAYSHQTHQRVDGAARIEFKATPYGRAALADLYQRAPARVLFPSVEAGDPTQAVLLTTSGGLTGGDRLSTTVIVGADAKVTVTTQAAEKIYRASVDCSPAVLRMRVSVGADAWAEWLAQETIVFDHASLDRRFEADVARGARLLATESLVFGRTAMRERFSAGFLHDAWRIRREGRLVWADALRLEGEVSKQQSAPFGFGTAVACSTMVYVGADAAQLLDEVRTVIGKHAVPGGATTFDDLLLVRLLCADAAKLRATVMALAATIRSRAAVLPARLPRVWSC